METYIEEIQAAADHVRQSIRRQPAIGILAGTGLGDCAATVAQDVKMAYAEIPHFPVSTVQSHKGNLVAGTLAGKPAIVMQGRFHLYEGYSPREVTFAVRMMQALGVKLIIVSNAAGGFHADFSPGDVMVISDHINLTGSNPLVGAHHAAWGPRFPDMGAVYDTVLAEKAMAAGQVRGLRMQRGVYAGLLGPSLETPAEVRYLKTIGADAVGFSTVHEVIVAVQAGMRVLGLSTITNINDPDAPVSATLEEIIAVAERAAPVLGEIIRDVVAGID
jgi:purine-nucleoside phosphorylase